MHILLVEDDQHIGNSLSKALRSENHTCDWMVSCSQANQAISQGNYDLIILDWALPDGSGVQLLQQQRQSGLETPVLMLTARKQISDKITGLDAGADDYLAKPFDLAELYARVRALGRRKTVAATSVISVNNIEINPDTRCVKVEHQEVSLSKGEFEILRILAERAGRYLSKAQIEQVAYEWDKAVTPNAIEAHISRLRKKIGTQRLVTLRGVGYCLEKG